MSAGVIGACVAPCFVSIINPWFFTSKCGQNGCPLFNRVANRSRAEVGARAEGIRQAGRKRRLWRCGEEWDQDEQMQEREAERNRSEPHQRTRPMQVSVGKDVNHLVPSPKLVDSEIIDRVNEGGSGDFGDKEKERRREEREGMAQDQDGRRDNGFQWPEFVEVPGGVPRAPPSVLSSGVISSVYTSRPMLDEAISWERLAGVGKESKKRKWWYMP